MATLLPPILLLRSRSPSIRSFTSSRSQTPVSSMPSSLSLVIQPPIVNLFPRIAEFLDDARDILHLSATARSSRNLRSSQVFTQHLLLNGWDVHALHRRAESSKSQSWLFLARSAVHKAAISTQYPSLPKEQHNAPSYTSYKDKKAVRRFFRTLVDIATEHDRNNFNTLAQLSAAHGLSLIRFVSHVRAHDWKTRYRKTFVIAAYINSQPPHLDAEADLNVLAENLAFDRPKPPLSCVAARANFLYAYGCTSSSIAVFTPRKPVPCTVYDLPHMYTPHGNPLPGIQHALDRFRRRLAVNGFYRRAGGQVTSLRMAFEPRGLASRSKLPFTEKDLLTLSAKVTDGDDHQWDIDGFFDLRTGVGKFKNPTGEISYEIWTTPWGLTGEKVRREGKRLGYFVLHWVSV